MGRENLGATNFVDMAAGIFRVPAAGSAQVATRGQGGDPYMMGSVDMAAGSVSVGGGDSNPVRLAMHTGHARVHGGDFHL